MTKYGYVRGRTPDQSTIQHEVLTECGMEFDGGIVVDAPWSDFFSTLKAGDEVVVVAESRLGATMDERQARKEMLELIGVNLTSLTRDFEKDQL